MSFRIERMNGSTTITFQMKPNDKPGTLVLTDQQLDAILPLLKTARNADQFLMSVVVK